MEGRGAAVSRAEGPETALRALLARPYVAVLGIWVVWAGAIVATVAIGIAAGAYDRARAVFAVRSRR